MTTLGNTDWVNGVQWETHIAVIQGFAVALQLIGIAAVVIVVVAGYRTLTSESPRNYLIFLMLFGDFGLCCACILTIINFAMGGKYAIGYAGCAINAFQNLYFVAVSVFSLSAISIERCRQF